MNALSIDSTATITKNKINYDNFRQKEQVNYANQQLIEQLLQQSHKIQLNIQVNTPTFKKINKLLRNQEQKNQTSKFSNSEKDVLRANRQGEINQSFNIAHQNTFQESKIRKQLKEHNIESCQNILDKKNMSVNLKLPLLNISRLSNSLQLSQENLQIPYIQNQSRLSTTNKEKRESISSQRKEEQVVQKQQSFKQSNAKFRTQQSLSSQKIEGSSKRQTVVTPFHIQITKKYIGKESVQQALLGQKRYEEFLKADEKDKYELYKDNVEKSKQNPPLRQNSLVGSPYFAPKKRL